MSHGWKPGTSLPSKAPVQRSIIFDIRDVGETRGAVVYTHPPVVLAVPGFRKYPWAQVTRWRFV